MICLGIIGAGVYAAKNLAIDAVPDVTNIQVQVVTRAPALSATEVESQITQPDRARMAGVPGLKLTRSVSKLGISIVTLDLQRRRRRLLRAAAGQRAPGPVREQIPSEIGKPELGPITTALGEIYMFELARRRALARRAPHDGRMADRAEAPAGARASSRSSASAAR